jgi:N6-adenosine-specific RNA methylase IME4
VPDAAKIIEAWGYRWVTMITWDKGRPGIAKYFQGVTEHCVFAVRGSVPYKFVDGKMQQGRTLVAEQKTDHSRKPVAMCEVIERVSYGPYLELFGRRVPKNWDAIGLELEEL